MDQAYIQKFSLSLFLALLLTLVWTTLAYADGPGGLDLRIDYSDDEGITTGGVDAEVTSVTVTGSLPLAAGVDARLEYRFDTSNEDIFADGSAGGDDILNTVQAQIVWHPESE